jgi:DHA2 family multidrug resistance protein
MQALVVSNTQTMHESLAGKVVPTDAVVRSGLPAIFNLRTESGLSALNAEITRQATMVAYVDDFKLMLIITLACLPMLLLMRQPRRSAPLDPAHAAVE